MRRAVAVCLFVVIATGVLRTSTALADGEQVEAHAETISDGIRVMLQKVGADYQVGQVAGGGAEHVGCLWSIVFAPNLDQVPYGSTAGPRPHPEARVAVLFCDGMQVSVIWVAPGDVIDLDAAARAEAERYVEDVLMPAVSIGANPAAKGLVGLRSWFWIEGFDGSVTAPPISAFGMTIDVRMSTGSVTWDFGDGTVEPGDLGQAYPAESSVQHAHQRDGVFTITATLDLVPEYRVDGGPWITLPNLTTFASLDHPVEERQAVVTRS